MEQQLEQNRLKNILLVLFKHKYKILIVFLTINIAVTIKTYLTTPVYQTDSTLMVQSGRESLYRPEVGEDKEMKILGLGALLNTETQILTSADLIEKVITDMGVENIYPDMIKQSPKGPTPVNEVIKKAATVRFLGNLSAKVVRNSNVIDVSFKHNDPQIAARAVNQLIESFKIQHIEIFRNPRSSFMEKQLTVYRQRLQKSEENLAAFKQKNRVFSIEKQRDLLLHQQLNFDTSLKDAQSGVLELQQKISSLTSQMQTIPKYDLSASNEFKSKNIGDAQNRLLTLQMQEQDLLSKYDESNRQITNIRKNIQILKDFLATNGLKTASQTTALSKNDVYKNLEISLLQARTGLSSQKAGIAAIKQQLSQVNGELYDLDAHEKELRNLERERDTDESNFKNYVTKLEDARIEDELDLMRKVNISVIQKATVPLGPIEPRKRYNRTVGIILGAASGLALAIFFGYIIDQGVSTPEGVEKRLGLPVLASVPYKKRKNSRI